MSRLWRNRRAFAGITVVGIRTFFTYRSLVTFFTVSMLLQVYLLKVVWTAIYGSQPRIDGVPIQTLIVYLTLTNLQLHFAFSDLPRLVRNRLREGQVATDLTRPLGFPAQLVANQLGGTIAGLTLLLPALPMALFLGGLALPASPVAGLLYVGSLGLAYLIELLIGMIVGLIAFWTLEIWGIQAILGFVSRFFSGALVPIWLFPGVLRKVAEMLPFQAIASIPASIFIGRISGRGVVDAIGLQVIWIVLLLTLAALVWRRAQRHIVVQGG